MVDQHDTGTNPAPPRCLLVRLLRKSAVSRIVVKDICPKYRSLSTDALINKMFGINICKKEIKYRRPVRWLTDLTIHARDTA